MLDICLTILTFTLCVWKACRRLKQNSKDCQAFFSHNDVAFSCFWRSLLYLCPFCWASVDWVYKAMFRVKLSTRSTIINVYGNLLHHFHFVTGMPAGTLSQRPSGVDEGSYQSSLCADACGRTRAMKTTSNSHESLMKSSQKNQKWFDDVWRGLHSTDLLRCPLFSCLIFSGQLTCRCPSRVSAKTFRHSFPVSKGSR